MTKWKLYWVESDGYEDCFVVAKNSRSAKSVEIQMNGFDSTDVAATRVMDIPDRFEAIVDEKFREWSREHAPQQANRNDLHFWPGYADKWLLEELGAQFRKIDDTDQVLLRDVVYLRGANGECSTYSIGAKALSERNKSLPVYNNYDNEQYIDISETIQQAMGLALTECQEIEWLFSKSFIFGVSEKQKKQYSTFDDFFDGWGKKTLGGLFTSIQESFEIESEIKNAMDLFLLMRNELVHSITTTERYNIHTDWGQRELISLLDVFLSLCMPIKEIAASCYEVSIGIANTYLLEGKDKIPLKTSEELIELFAHCFKLKTTL